MFHTMQMAPSSHKLIRRVGQIMKLLKKYLTGGSCPRCSHCNNICKVSGVWRGNTSAKGGFRVTCLRLTFEMR